MKQTAIFIVRSKYGLHARPAAELVHIAGTFQSEIVLCCNGIYADAKSFLSLLCLGAACGSKLSISACGSDAAAALSAIGQTSSLSASSTESYDKIKKNCRTI